MNGTQLTTAEQFCHPRTLYGVRTGLYMTYSTYCILRTQSKVHTVLSQLDVQYVLTVRMYNRADAIKGPGEAELLRGRELYVADFRVDDVMCDPGS